jgi:hypothetical protein
MLVPGALSRSGWIVRRECWRIDFRLVRVLLIAGFLDRIVGESEEGEDDSHINLKRIEESREG